MQHRTVDEMLAAWDAGQTIWTISMGEFGPGYEQAIQVAAVEFARDNQLFQRTEDKDVDWVRFGEACDNTLKRIDQDLGGITDAMYGAAKQLAWWWCCDGGPEALIERAKKDSKDDRIIQCQRDFPKVRAS